MTASSTRSLISAPPSSYDLPARCVVQYKALLDLAALARHYGNASPVFLDALGDMADRLSDCLSGPGAPAEGNRADLLAI
ncbi:MAG TPA: hypothetical protein VMA37_01805 [Acetobacteraceae bacterium]|nr:hypothetical protein [Acetobacteraceae bacterium]